MFALRGRIGRVRYLLYLSLLLTPAAFLSVATPGLPLLAMLIPSLAGILAITRRRMNDMGQSGWWGLLCLVPVANLVFCLWPLLEAGSAEANEHGLPPAPHSWPLALAAAVLPVCLLVVPALLDRQARQGPAHGRPAERGDHVPLDRTDIDTGA